MNQSRKPIDLGDEVERQRLGSAGLKAFRRTMRIWHASEETSRMLLGVTPGTNLGSLDAERMGEEQMLRISYLLGIYKALHIYWGEELADKWVGLPNTDPMFGGRSPLAYIADGGLDALRNLRKLLDAWCVGH